MSNNKNWILKYLFILITSFTSEETFSQKNLVVYKGNFLTIDIFENRLTPNQKLLSSKVYGTDILITVDTIFKSYRLEFKDENYKSVQMTLKYIQDYFPKKDNNNEINKLYLMTCQDTRFFLTDYLDMPPPINQLSFSYIDDLRKNQTPVFFVKNAIRVY